jgi:P-type Ca2+ transporter type 2B
MEGSTEKLAKTMVFIGMLFFFGMVVVLFSYDLRKMGKEETKVISNKGIQTLLSSFIEAFMILVLSVPEGLPLILTLSLSNTVKNLRVKKNLKKKKKYL